jgi:two-component sensor histidine kinase
MTIVAVSLRPYLHAHVAPPFFAAVMFAAWYGGIGPGLFATALSLLAVGYFILPPALSLQLEFEDVLHLGVLAAVAVLISYLSGQQKRAAALLRADRERIAEYNRRLQQALVESHHRIKNNLQLVSAMMEMRQSDGNGTGSAQFAELSHHIRALASLHDLLAHCAREDPELREISGRELLERLCAALRETFPRGSLEYHIEDIAMRPKQGASLALIVSELVTNAFKHGGRHVRIEARSEGDRAAVRISDDGRGFPKDFDALRDANMGVELVRTLASTDLGGCVTFENNETCGARVTVRFPVGPVEALRR